MSRTAKEFVGAGAVVDKGLGPVDTADEVGFSAQVASLTLVLVTDDTRSYTGLSISGLAADLVGIDGLVARATAVNVQLNMAADSTVVVPDPVERLDWAAFTPG